MVQEIERRFLVQSDHWRAVSGEGALCRQGYLTAGSSNATVRVRLKGGRGYLTVKGLPTGISRPELEYEIPVADAEYMLENLCETRIVSKMRYTFSVNELQWEVDEFLDKNEGLVLAEIELETENQFFEKPDWTGREVSLDKRYTNASLAEHPFSEWNN